MEYLEYPDDGVPYDPDFFGRSLPPSGSKRPTDGPFDEEDEPAKWYRQVDYEDALNYCSRVKAEVPALHQQFLELIMEFKAQAIDTPHVIERVRQLFHGHDDLILAFNVFLPIGYHLQVRCATTEGAVPDVPFQCPEVTREEEASMNEYAAAQADLEAKRADLEAAKARLAFLEGQREGAIKARKEVLRDAPKATRVVMDAEVTDAKARVAAAKAALPAIEKAITAAEERMAAAAAQDYALRVHQEDWKTLNDTKGLLVVPLAEHGLNFDPSGIRYPDDITMPDDGAVGDVTGKGRRLMGHLKGNSTAPSIRALQDGMRGFMQRRRWLRTATGTGKASFLECKETRSLKSEANCPKQKRHADSAARNSLRDRPWGDVPKVALLFPEGGTLHVYPFDEEG